MLNQIVLMGRLTRDPELRYTQNQIPVSSFTLAVDRDFASRGEEKQTDFIDIVAWRKTAEFVSNYFRQGSMAVVVGRLQIRRWQDKEGQNRRTAEVVAESVYFGEPKRRSDEGDSYSYNSSQRNDAPDYPDYSSFSEIDDSEGGDLPF